MYSFSLKGNLTIRAKTERSWSHLLIKVKEWSIKVPPAWCLGAKLHFCPPLGFELHLALPLAACAGVSRSCASTWTTTSVKSPSVKQENWFYVAVKDNRQWCTLRLPVIMHCTYCTCLHWLNSLTESSCFVSLPQELHISPPLAKLRCCTCIRCRCTTDTCTLFSWTRRGLK